MKGKNRKKNMRGKFFNSEVPHCQTCGSRLLDCFDKTTKVRTGTVCQKHHA